MKGDVAVDVGIVSGDSIQRQAHDGKAEVSSRGDCHHHGGDDEDAARADMRVGRGGRIAPDAPLFPAESSCSRAALGPAAGGEPVVPAAGASADETAAGGHWEPLPAAGPALGPSALPGGA